MKNLNNTPSPTLENRWLIIITIMLVTILEVLDSTIVNIALPKMMSSLGANQDQITWVLTSYIVASAIFVPLTGFLSHRIGIKQLLVISITGFMISSFLCGISQSLAEIVLFRLLQGAFGASLIPLSLSVLRTSFSLAEQGKAMAIWGIGIMTAPAFGPTLGGYITQHASWRWIFYLNTPICIIGLLLTLIAIKPSKKTKQKIDYIGILLMFIGIGALQIFVDKGNTNDWFNSNFILLLSVVSTFCIILFIMRSLSHKTPVINLAIYKDRNFSLSCILLTGYAACMFGLITLEPIMLETLFHYTAIIAGITMAPLGLLSAFGMMLSSILMKKINIKRIVITGLLLCALGTYLMSTSITPHTMQSTFILIFCLQGLGMGLFMVPLSTYALATIAKPQITEASGLFSYARLIGASLGISLLNTLTTRLMQINWNALGGNISVFSGNLRLWLSEHHLKLHSPKTIIILSKMLGHQSGLLSFTQSFRLVSILFMILIPLVIAMKKVNLSD